MRTGRAKFSLAGGDGVCHSRPVASHGLAGAFYWHFVDSVWLVLFPLLYLGGRS
jgi:heme/copper-type cytochrome/quinol oxidase subunit 3